MTRVAAVAAVGAIGVAMVVRVLSSVRVQAFLRKHDEAYAMAIGFALGVVVVSMVVVGFLWIRRISGDIGDPDRSFWRYRRRTDDPGWRGTVLVELGVAAFAVLATVGSALSQLHDGSAYFGTGPQLVVWAFGPAAVGLVAFAWMLDHAWAAWQHEAERPGDR